jgi:hypothetical protein
MSKILINSVKEVTTGITDGTVSIGKRVQAPFEMVDNKLANSFAKNSVTNFDTSSKLCPIFDKG